MKLNVLFVALFLCIAFLLAGCDQAEVPTPDNSNTTTSNSTTTTTETTGVLFATQVPNTISSRADINELPTSRADNEYVLYRSAFTTTFDELCEYAEDPETCKAQIDAFVIQVAKEQQTDPYRPNATILDYIRIGNFKKEDVVDYFEKCMQEAIDNGWVKSDEDKRRHTYFSYEEIDILFSGDDRLIKETFKGPCAVLANDGQLYSFRWFTDHSVDEWISVGVTMENSKEEIANWKTVYGDLYLDWVGISDKLEEFYNAA